MKTTNKKLGKLGVILSQKQIGQIEALLTELRNIPAEYRHHIDWDKAAKEMFNIASTTPTSLATKCEDCLSALKSGQVVCEECCAHEFDSSEGYMCLNCGKDGSEDVMAAAYDRAKDFRKYGE